jgi:serine/threonine-protein kinase
MRLVQGSGPHLTGETQCLLRSRLRAAAVLLFATGLFLLRDLVLGYGLPAELAQLSVCREFLFWSHLGLVGVLALNSIAVCRHCAIPLAWLRVAELVIFGSTLAFLWLSHNFMVRYSVAADGVVPLYMGAWILVTLTYALFIPNTWRRAAAVIGIATAMPVALMVFQLLNYDDVWAAIGAETLTAIPLLSIITFVAGVYGTHTINSLRTQAFAAQELGQYRLKQLIGAGGMGEVYLAEHQLLKRPCAIKLIRPEQAGDPKALARFEREVRSTAKLSHWNTVEIFDYGHTEDGVFYYAMEYLPGMSLADLVKQHGPLPAERAVHLLRQTCDALAEAHQMGMVHRDIKPANIFAAKRGGVYDVAKLLDFGLAKPLGHTGDAQLTQEGSITGSPLFMSPEQASGDTEPDARSDIYSLGAVAYHIVTGRAPFEDDKPLKVLMAHIRDNPPEPSSIHSGVPADLEAVILRCLAKQPVDRYQTAEELEQALAACAAADGWTRADAARWWQSGGRETATTAAVAFA